MGRNPDAAYAYYRPKNRQNGKPTKEPEAEQDGAYSSCMANAIS